VSGVRLRSPAAGLVSLLVPLGLVGLTVALGSVGSASVQASVSLILCNLIVVCGLQVFIGNSGVYSFGQVAFTAVGAYLAALLTLPAAFVALQTPALPGFLLESQPAPLLMTLIAAGACGLLALVVGLPLMRTSTLAIPISTFAFLLVTYTVIANWDRLTGGSAGLVSIPTTTGVTSAGAWAAVAVVVALAFKRSASGYRLQATREDEVAARSLGIGVLRERLLGFALSAMLCGAGGALAAHQAGVLTPSSFYFAATVTTLTMLVVGGTRSVLGAVSGALTVALVNEVLSSLGEGASIFGLISIGETPGLAAIGLGLILLATMIKMPDGLSGGREAGELWLWRGPRPTPSLPSPVSAGRVAALTRAAGRPKGWLRAEDVSVSFAGLRVLRGVGLELECGEALGLVGPNGAGKTTLVNVLSGFQRPDSGKVRLDDTDVTGWAPARLARSGLGRSFQAGLPFSKLSCLESIAVGAMGTGRGKRAAIAVGAELLERLSLAEVASQEAGTLPPGKQRLLGVARALAIGPRYLLLDEPAAGLNEREGIELVEALRGVLADFGCGMLVIEHDMSLVMELCARVQVIDDGATVALGAPAEVQSDPAVIESYLGSGFLAGAGA
jgi:branched-chain amino acid transport system permease protein